MILDTSAVVAMIRREPGSQSLLERLADGTPAIGAPTLVEAGVVLSGRLGVRGLTLLGRFLQEAEVEILPFEEEHWAVSVDAYRHFGKGRHRAGLNFGDCLTYAVAKISGEPLLALGDDFRHTDLELV